MTELINWSCKNRRRTNRCSLKPRLSPTPSFLKNSVRILRSTISTFRWKWYVLYKLQQTKKEAKFNVFAHEKQWKSSSPNKSGLYGYFEPFPKYMENPKPESKRKSLDPNAKPSFKSMNHTSSSQPSPSVSNNTVNLRKIATIALRHWLYLFDWFTFNIIIFMNKS